MTHQADKNDLAHALTLTSKGVRIVGFDVPFKNGRHHFNTSRFIRSDGKMMDVISVQPVYYATPSGHFRPLYEVAESGNKSITLKLGWEQKMDMGYVRWLTGRCALLGGAVLMPMSRVPIAVAAVSTFYPDADTETTSVDGRCGSSLTISDWTTKRNEAGNSFDDAFSPATMVKINYSASGGGGYRSHARGFTLFDTSSLGASAIISSASASLYIESLTDGFAETHGVDIVSSAPASNTALEAGDYDSLGTTAFASVITLASMSTGAYNDWTLNASGEAAISLTGISKFGWRIDADRSDTEPATPGSTVEDSVNASTAENANGTAQAPKLVVTFTAPVSFIPRVLNVF